MTGGTSPAPLPNFTRRHQTMKVLKALLAVLTTLAVALTGVFLHLFINSPLCSRHKPDAQGTVLVLFFYFACAGAAAIRTIYS